MSEPIVSLTDVTCRFADVTAIEGLNLEICPAETVVLLGPNGAGKTTALEMILGLLLWLIDRVCESTTPPLALWTKSSTGAAR